MVSGPDVVVVGAGIIGCAVARELARRGANVQVIEARGVARGATWAAAGMLAPYLEAHEGGAFLDLAVRSLDLYDGWIEDVRADSAMDVEYRRSGSLQVAMDSAAAARLKSTVGGLVASGLISWVDPAELREIEPALSAAALGALSVPTHGYVAAPTLAEALARAASARGARFHFGSRVSRIDPDESHVTVIAEDGKTWRAEQVIVAAGSWTGQVRGLPDAAAACVRPVRGQLLRLTWHASPLAGVIWGPSCYVVPWRDGTILVGATMEDVGFDERNTAVAIRSLLDAGRTLLPEMDDATFIDARAGLRPATPDGLPFIGQSASSRRITYASGHYRNGILLAPLTARLVADAVLDAGADPLLLTLSPARFGAHS